VALDHWKLEFEAEMRAAVKARAAGNEGKARVCARRAAGILVGEYFDQRNILPATSAIKRLEILYHLPGSSAEVQQIVEHLLRPVDQNHLLPSSIDLLAETRMLLLALELED
jgi:hypothetical protein